MIVGDDVQRFHFFLHGTDTLKPSFQFLFAVEVIVTFISADFLAEPLGPITSVEAYIGKGRRNLR